MSPELCEPVLDVVCLCADWCGTCREYRVVFAELQALRPGHRYRWIDIEDEADLIGDVDVETFPTWMVAHQGQLRFGGTVLPRLHDALRLLDAQMAAVAQGGTSAMTVALPADQVQAFAALAAQISSAANSVPRAS